MLTLFISSLALGLAYCAPPGAVTAETLRRGLGRGFWPALLVQFGSLIGDGAWALLAISGAAFLVQNLAARLGLSALGIILLIKLTWSALQDARLGRIPIPKNVSPQDQSGASAFMVGALLSLSNPYAIVFWLSLGSTVFTGAQITNPQWTHVTVFYTAFLGVAVAWCFLLAGLASWGRKLIRPALFKWVNLACAAFMAFLSVQLTWNLLTWTYELFS